MVKYSIIRKPRVFSPDAKRAPHEIIFFFSLGSEQPREYKYSIVPAVALVELYDFFTNVHEQAILPCNLMFDIFFYGIMAGGRLLISSRSGKHFLENVYADSSRGEIKGTIGNIVKDARLFDIKLL